SFFRAFARPAVDAIPEGALSMKLRCLAPILLASLTLSISPRSTWAQVKHSSISGTPVQVEVTLKSAADNAANLSRVAGRVGRVFVKDSKHHAYRLAVKSGMPADRAVAHLKSDRAV